MRLIQWASLAVATVALDVDLVPASDGLVDGHGLWAIAVSVVHIQHQEWVPGCRQG